MVAPELFIARVDGLPNSPVWDVILTRVVDGAIEREAARSYQRERMEEMMCNSPGASVTLFRPIPVEVDFLDSVLHPQEVRAIPYHLARLDKDLEGHLSTYLRLMLGHILKEVVQR